uniref:hypothetical protein n=1 Tax=Thaumasiovibrio occultus TaxID=1891184 RepID=UPI000B361FA1|nr:hypothetical protein [Thaumasiovibrio occultus]
MFYGLRREYRWAHHGKARDKSLLVQSCETNQSFGVLLRQGERRLYITLDHERRPEVVSFISRIVEKTEGRSLEEVITLMRTMT